MWDTLWLILIRVTGIRCAGIYSTHSTVGLDTVSREFTYLVNLAVDGELEGNPQHLVIVQTLVQGDVTQLGIQLIFAGCQSPCIVLYHIIDPIIYGHSTKSLGNGGHIPDLLVQDRGFGTIYPKGVKVVVPVVGKCPWGHIDETTGYGLQPNIRRIGLTNVLDGHNAPHIIGGVVSVGHPNLYPGDLDIGIDKGILGQDPVVVITEVVRQEEVTVLVVIQCKELERCNGGTSFGSDGLGLGLLLREYSGDGGISELQFGLDPKKTLRPLDQGAVQWHAHITHLDLTDDIVFSRGEFQFDLVLEVKGRLGVVIGRDLQSLTHLTQKTQADALIEIERQVGPVPGREGRIVLFGEQQSQVHLHRTLWDHLDGIPPEDGLEEIRVHIEGRKQVLLGVLCPVLTSICRIDLFLEIVPHLLLTDQILVLFRGEDDGIIDGKTTQGLGVDVTVCNGIVGIQILDTGWNRQVHLAFLVSGSR